MKKIQNIGKFQVTVNYETSIEEMVACGKYDLINLPNVFSMCEPWWDIRKYKKLRGKKPIIELFHIEAKKSVNCHTADFVLGKSGCRPANVFELLALGEKYPEIQRLFPIVSLCSTYNSRFFGHGFICLSSTGLKRSLEMVYPTSGQFTQDDYFLFAAVRLPTIEEYEKECRDRVNKILSIPIKVGK